MDPEILIYQEAAIWEVKGAHLDLCYRAIT
jgi:hypothetical protein